YEVRIGCSCRSIVEAAGGFVSEPFDLISGGPLMGKAMPSLDVPVLKTTSSILALNEEEAQDYESSNCIRCGRCAAVCPSRVLPMKLVKCTDRNDYQGFEEQNGLECCECGCCSYVCPARIKLTPSFAKARKVIQLKKNRMKNKKKN
ncbi:MAG TPA: 4Fe-4S binding protein, partial [Candidatus Merdenecus merdavium]|nr:4Fe-4S binding protein [Candidatus Merdenecus merdavium]